MSGHALLSPSSSERWINCPPSAKENAGGDTRHLCPQGTDAHALCEYKVKQALGHKVRDPTDDLEYFDEEMAECTDAYCEFVMEQVQEAKEFCDDTLFLLEQLLDFSRWVDDSFGTADCIVVADGVMTVIDFKYGLGVLVEAEGNSQMRMYALGALNLFESLYDIKTVRMIIFQPRRDNVSTAEVTTEELLRWADDVLIPAAALAANGDGDYKAGKHCQFCKIKATCRKRAEYNLQLAHMISPYRIHSLMMRSAVLDQADTFIGWVNDVKVCTGAGYQRKSYPAKVVEDDNRRCPTPIPCGGLQAGMILLRKKLIGVTAILICSALKVQLPARLSDRSQANPPRTRVGQASAWTIIISRRRRK